MSFLLNRTALVRLKALVKAGKFVDRAWSFSAADSNALLGDNNWTEYGLWFLGKDETANRGAARSKEAFDYPYGKKGIVNLDALRTIIRQSRARGDLDVMRAAKEVLGMANKILQERATAKHPPYSGRRAIAFAAPVQIAAAAAADGAEKPGPPTFSMVAYTGGPMRLQGWDYPVVVDLEGIEGVDKSRPALRDHDQGRVVGHTTAVAVHDGKLLASGVVSGSGPDAKEVAQTGQNGFPWQASIGANVIKNQFVPEGESATANGQTFQGPLNIARRTSIGEISFVALGADDDTSARIAALAAKANHMDFEAWLSARGFKAADLSDEQCKAMKAIFAKEQSSQGDDDDDSKSDADDDDDKDDDDDAGDAPDGEEGSDEDDDDDADDDDEDDADAEAACAKAKNAKAKKAKAKRKHMSIRATRQTTARVRKTVRATYAAETKRVLAIQALTKDHPKIQAKAIEDGWDTTRTELEVLRASRPTLGTPGAAGSNGGTFAIISKTSGQDVTANAIAAAGAISGGIREEIALKDLDDRTKEVVTSKQLRGMGMHRIMATVAASYGIRCAAGDIDGDFIRKLFQAERQMDIRAEMGGFSTMSLSGITANILNKAMLQAYGDVPSVVPDVCYETDTMDFKPYGRYRLTASGVMQPVGPDGELKTVSLQDESYMNQVEENGCLINVPRPILVNDDMGALTQIPTLIGRQSAIFREKTVFTTLLRNPSVTVGTQTGNFFSSTWNNYLSGSSSALSIAAVTSAVQLFLQQKDANGQPIMIEPDRLLLPPALFSPGMELFKGTTQVVTALGSTSSKQVAPNINVHAGTYKPIKSPYLAAAFGLPNASDTSWMLLPNPSGGFSPITVGYLRGQRVPVIERGEGNFNTLGISVRCWYDFGVALLDNRCAVLSAGA